MNVQELIDALGAVEDKSLPVELEGHCCYTSARGVQLLPADEPWTSAPTLLITSGGDDG